MSNGDDDVPLGGSERAGGMPSYGGGPPADPPGVRRAQAVEPEVRRAEPVEVRKAQPVTLEDRFKSATEVAYDNYRQLRSDQAQALKEEEWYTQQKQRLLSEPMPKMPSFEEMFSPGPYGGPPAQTQALTPQQQGFKFGHFLAYSAVAYPLALLSGKRGQAAWNAMEAAGIGMNGIASGNRGQANAAGVLWKEQNDEALKWGDARLRYYEKIIQNRNTDLKEKLELAETMATFYKDKVTADIAASGEWDKFIGHLGKLETVLNNAHKVRAAHEMAIMTDLGLGPEMKAYVQQMYTQNKDLRAGLQSEDPAEYMKAYDEGVTRFPFKKFHEAKLKEQEQQKLKLYKEEHPEEFTLPPGAQPRAGAPPPPAQTGPQSSATPMSPADAQQLQTRARSVLGRLFSTDQSGQ